jgi:transposase-like protein
MDQRPTPRRQYHSPTQWQALLAQFETSGLSVVAFCRRHGLSNSSFYRRRTQLAGGYPATSTSATTPPTEFVDLGPLMAKPSNDGRLELRLELGGGLTLTLVRN